MNKTLITLFCSLTATTAVAECYSVWRGPDLLYENRVTPVDLSTQISAGVQKKFGKGAHMIMVPGECEPAPIKKYPIEVYEYRITEVTGAPPPVVIYNTINNTVNPQPYDYYQRWDRDYRWGHGHRSHNRDGRRSFIRDYTPSRPSILTVPKRR